MLSNIALSLIFIFFPGSKIARDTSFNELYPILNEYVRDFPQEFRRIPEERRYRLHEMVYFLEEQKRNNAPRQVTFISTNESAIAQMALAWSKAAAYYFGFNDFFAYSGGLAPEHISVNSIMALENAGFIVYKSQVNKLDVFRIKYAYNLEPLIAFPKKLNHVKNPGDNYMAVVLDANADMNLSNIKGTYHRLFLEYDDPKGYGGTDLEMEKYHESCQTIAVEMFYVFSQLYKRSKAN